MPWPLVEFGRGWLAAPSWPCCWAPESIGAPETIEVVANGQVIRTASDILDFDWDVSRRGGEKVRSADAGAIAEKRLKELDFIEARLKDPKYVKEYGPGEVDALRERMMLARRIYEKLP